jgi:tetraacyldisaccharide-1-P 4'-kinase
MTFDASRLVVAGMSGDSGKTLVALALVLGARDRGMLVRTFKKGPGERLRETSTRSLPALTE